MKKLKSNAGFTLIEILVALAILVVLVVGMGASMNAGTRIYHEATFESDSASMAGILNTNLGDILRYSQDIRVNTGSMEDSEGTYHSATKVPFVFTNLEYGIQDAYFEIVSIEDSDGVLQMKSLKNTKSMDLVNTGAYPGLKITEFQIEYVPASATLRGGYFNVSYKIYSNSDEDLSRDVTAVIRLMNQ